MNDSCQTCGYQLRCMAGMEVIVYTCRDCESLIAKIGHFNQIFVPLLLKCRCPREVLLYSIRSTWCHNCASMELDIKRKRELERKPKNG